MGNPEAGSPELSGWPCDGGHQRTSKRWGRSRLASPCLSARSGHPTCCLCSRPVGSNLVAPNWSRDSDLVTWAHPPPCRWEIESLVTTQVNSGGSVIKERKKEWMLGDSKSVSQKA